MGFICISVVFSGVWWLSIAIDCLLLVPDSQAASASSDPLLSSIFPESELQSKKRPPTVSLLCCNSPSVLCVCC